MPAALAAIEGADKCLGDVLATLERKNVRDKTDIFVVSDHGFSTIARSINLLPLLNGAGFHAFTEFSKTPQTGEIMVVGNGGSVLFYVIGHDTAVVQHLVSYLQQSDFAGVIFSREKIEGTFSLADAKIDTPASPDVVMSFRWNRKPNEFGAPGMINADWNRKPGTGTHATLSRFDMHNTLIANGPDFRRDMVDHCRAAMSISRLLFCAFWEFRLPKEWTGRVLSEAMIGGKASCARNKNNCRVA